MRTRIALVPVVLTGSCAGGCTEDQLCSWSSEGCRTGVNPQWLSTAGWGSPCLPPAVSWPGIGGGCSYTCGGPSDCPWTSTCGGGYCN